MSKQVKPGSLMDLCHSNRTEYQREWCEIMARQQMAEKLIAESREQRETVLGIDEVIQAACRVFMDTALQLIQSDPHQWSERPCQTCKAVGAMLGRTFGCYEYARRKAEIRGVNR